MSHKRKAVLAGEVQFFSPSSLSLGDLSSGEGCPRKYFFRYVLGIKPPDKDATDIGKQVHGEIEEYLKTGRNSLGPIAIRGKHLLPTPGPDLIVECQADDLVKVDGTPIVQRIDYLNLRGINYGGSDITDTHDGPYTAEVGDHKTTSDFKYAKDGKQLIGLIPMVLYGEAALAMYPAAQKVRLTHNYFHTKKALPGIKATAVHTPEQIHKAAERLIPVAQLLKQTARQTDVSKVEANARACGAYGGCYYLDKCPGSSTFFLSELFGNVAGQLLPSVKENAAMSNPFATNPFAAATAPVAAPAAAPSAVSIHPAFPAALAWLQKAGNLTGRGFPTLDGNAADAYHTVVPQAIAVARGTRHGGTGAFGALTPITEQPQLIQFATDMSNWLGAGTSGIAPDVVAQIGPFNATAPATVPFGAPAAAPTPAATAPVAAAPAAPAAATPATAEAPKRGRGRPRKDASAPPSNGAPVGSAPGPAPQGTEGLGLRLFVDCAYVNGATTDLRPWVDSIEKAILDKYAPGLPSVLMANDGPLAFGAWRGLVIAMAQQGAESLAEGDYTLYTGGNAIAECAADALRNTADLYVRGRV